jgi:ribulose-phosphate 3-epimerase|tara:strand:- start:4604 stop:5257 length:654 start_codon:yes stop_codon:yes gene_type:complete
MTNYVKIAPSILSSNFSKLGEEITTLDNSECDYIHIDVMDGHFVPNLTLGPDIVKSIRPYTKKIFDVHLMINPVMNILPSFIKAGSDIITIHHEISDNVFDCIDLIKKHNLKVGVSIKPSTEAKEIIPYLELIDLILVMTVEPGFGGQKFLTSQLKKIKEIKGLISTRNIELEVDGGINYITSKQVVEAGANVLVSGSTIFSSKNYNEAILKLRGND